MPRRPAQPGPRGSTTKPERVSFGVSAGDSYRFWIVNFGPQRESGTFVAGLTQ